MTTQKSPRVAAVIGFLLISATASMSGNILSTVGAGNFNNGKLDTTAQQKLEALEPSGGAGMIRINLYPGSFYRNGEPSPDLMEALVVEAHGRGVDNILLLFEYYGTSEYAPLDSFDWFAIGQAFAAKYQPNSSFLTGMGITDWGIRFYQAINEPDLHNTIEKSKYAQALKDLADGVHSVYANAKVLPGGFMAQNAWEDNTCRGYLPAIASLLNSGTLDGIDLHTYNDLLHASILKWHESPQRDFEQVKNASGITRDLPFYASEFNVKVNPNQGLTETEAAKYHMTSLFANLCVTKEDGSPATGFALVWNLFQNGTQSPSYGMNATLGPWTPRATGHTWQRVLGNLLPGMTIEAVDTPQKGVHRFSSNDAVLWVKQNLFEWTTQVGPSWTIDSIPGDITSFEVWYWDGLSATISGNGSSSQTFSGLRTGETVAIIGKRSAAALEAQELTIDGDWQSVTFQRSFNQTPVVVASPISSNQDRPTTVRIKDLTPTGFSIRLQNWGYLGSQHDPETVFILAMEPGVQQIGGLTWEAGRIIGVDHNWSGPHYFSHTFDLGHALFTQVETINGTAPVATRVRNLYSTSFQVKVQEEEAADGNHATESIGYIAIEGGSGSQDGLSFEVGLTGWTVSNNWELVSFSQAESEPLFYAAPISTIGADPGGLRFRTLTDNSVEILFQEEQSLDQETTHANEKVGWMIIK